MGEICKQKNVKIEKEMLLKCFSEVGLNRLEWLSEVNPQLVLVTKECLKPENYSKFTLDKNKCVN